MPGAGRRREGRRPRGPGREPGVPGGRGDPRRPFLLAVTRADETGATPLLVAADGRPLGTLLARDVERADAAEMVAGLHRLGIETILLSGDRRAAAEATARRLGIPQARAEVPPLGKAQAVRDLRGAGRAWRWSATG